MLKLAVVATLASFGLVQACNVVSGVHMTFYGSPDNDPPGSVAIAHNCGRGFKAGGTGTHDDPLTFASAPGEYKACEVIYSPYLKKYIRLEDDCAQCIEDQKKGIKHIDIWTGDAKNGGQNQINCENKLTPDKTQSVVRSPPANLAVDKTALFSSNTCHTDHVFPKNKASCSSAQEL